jgi:putative membrane protein
MAHGVPGPGGPPPLPPGGFDWTAWNADPSVVAGLVVAGAAYTGALLLRRRLDPEARVAPHQVLAFGGALAVLFVALTGPIHDLSDYYLFSAHMIQHMLLVFAMPPLLLHGVPGWMIRPLVRGPALLRLGRWLTRPSGAFATFNLVLVAWHLPPIYNLAMEQHPFHVAGHLLMIAAAVVLWWPMLSPLPELPRAPYPLQMLYLFLVGLPMVVVSIFISMADGILYPYYARAPRVVEALTPRVDQHLGGLLMWVPGGLIFLVALTVVFFRWQAAGGDDVTVGPPAKATHGG